MTDHKDPAPLASLPDTYLDPDSDPQKNVCTSYLLVPAVLWRGLVLRWPNPP